MADRPLRLFVAFAVPRERLEVLDAALSPVRTELSGARWTPLENQHVTLKFLGSTPLERLDAVEDACATVARVGASFETRLTHAGAFPNERRARVLWVGLDDPGGTIRSVAGALDQRLRPLGYEPEKRPFTPHLTLARFKVPARIELPRLSIQASDPFIVGDLRLYRSRLHPTGARYELLESFALGAP